MTSEHPDREALVALALDDGEGSASLAAHLATCAPCAVELSEIKALLGAITNPDVWSELDLLRHQPTDEEIAAVREESETLERERSDAAYVARELRTMPIAEWQGLLEGRSDTRTRGMFRQLISEVRQEHNRQPTEALLILDCAWRIATELDPPHRFRACGETWKERSNALRLMGRYADAMEALDHAETEHAAGGLAELPLADVRRARATILFALKRFTEAHRWIRSASETYRAFHEQDKLAQAQVVEAGILYEQGDTDAAAAIFQSVAAIFEALDDEESLARTLAGLCACAVRLDDDDRAREYAARAVEKYRRLDMPTEIIRLRWNLSQGLLRHGASAAGLAELRAAAEEFTSRGVISGASAVGLDIVEELLVLGQIEEAQRLATHLAEVFTASGSEVDAARAYAQLREAAGTGTMTSELVRAIRVRLSTELEQSELAN